MAANSQSSPHGIPMACTRGVGLELNRVPEGALGGEAPWSVRESITQDDPGSGAPCPSLAPETATSVCRRPQERSCLLTKRSRANQLRTWKNQSKTRVLCVSVCNWGKTPQESGLQLVVCLEKGSLKQHTSI